jgi:hypothetical protein
MLQNMMIKTNRQFQKVISQKSPSHSDMTLILIFSLSGSQVNMAVYFHMSSVSFFFHISTFFKETIVPNWNQTCRNSTWMVSYIVCDFHSVWMALHLEQTDMVTCELKKVVMLCKF